MDWFYISISLWLLGAVSMWGDPKLQQKMGSARARKYPVLRFFFVVIMCLCWPFIQFLIVVIAGLVGIGVISEEQLKRGS